MILRIALCQFLALFSTSLLVGVVAHANISDKRSCSELMAPEDSLRLLKNEFMTYTESFHDGEFSSLQLEAYKQTFYPRLQALLEEQGLNLKWNETNYKGFEILGIGEHFLSRLARGLNKYGVLLKISPELWSRGGSASAQDGIISIDFQSLVDQRLTPVLAHEIRHAMNELWSQHPVHEFERRFQVAIDGLMTQTGQIPNAKFGSYSSWFSLDEILALRQSISQWLRELRRNLQNETPTKHTLFQLKQQSTRMLEFAQWWTGHVSVLEKEVRSGHFTHEFPEQDQQRDFPTLKFKITRPSDFERLLRRSEVNPSFLGLSVSLLVSREEQASLSSKRSARKLILKKLSETSLQISLIEPLIIRFNDSIQNFDGENVGTLEKALSEINSLKP